MAIISVLSIPRDLKFSSCGSGHNKYCFLNVIFCKHNFVLCIQNISLELLMAKTVSSANGFVHISHTKFQFSCSSNRPLFLVQVDYKMNC